jgi:hypothetical protein
LGHPKFESAEKNEPLEEFSRIVESLECASTSAEAHGSAPSLLASSGRDAVVLNWKVDSIPNGSTPTKPCNRNSSLKLFEPIRKFGIAS